MINVMTKLLVNIINLINNVSGTADSLSQDCLNVILNNIKLREKIFGKAQELEREEISRKVL